MSFFGFDSSLPKGGKSKREKPASGGEKPLDFEDTYRGLGDYAEEDGDYLNNETFGANAELGTDFDFGHAASTQSPQVMEAPAGSYVTSNRSYVAAATSGESQTLETNLDLKPMESLWGHQAPQQSPHQIPQQVPQQPIAMPPQKVAETLSMEELERQQRQSQQMAAQGFMVPPPGYIPPQGFMQQPQQGNVPFPNQYPAPFSPGAMPPQFQQVPMMYQGGQTSVYPPPQEVQQQAQAAQAQAQAEAQSQAQSQAQAQAQAQSQSQAQAQAQAQSQSQSQSQTAQPQQQAQQQFPQPITSPGESLHAQVQVPDRITSPRGVNTTSTRFSPQFGPPHGQRDSLRHSRGPGRRDTLTPEEQRRLQVRQAKVEKILRHSGLMTPRDKDFITRYQLSQIVTEDPYNEDFYFQVYKIIQCGGVVGESNKDLIARAYLEHSGHRLGGRYKRADVALQRMQSQVEKAVTVAKERPQKNKDHSDSSREGVLGKISSAMNSKAPRRQLLIPVHKSDSESAILDDSASASGKNSRGSTPALDVVTDSLENVEISQRSRARRRSSYAFSSVDQNSVLSRSGGRKFVLALIETVYGVVLELEEQLRRGHQIDSTTLWEALHIGDEAYDVCPFISMLSFDKGIKIIPRIFNFLDKSQKLKLLQTFFGELSHLNIIIISSYKTNDSPTESQLRKIDLFQSIFLKIIVSFLSNSADFIEIMGLLLYLIKNNNVSFISTSKIGLNLITVLISRAALIKQDINRSNVLSSPEISAWNGVYDKLFTALETKLSLVFPPKEYMDKVLSASSRPSTAVSSQSPSSNGQSYDQAYIWQFLASLALSGKLNHQRIIIDEIRDEIFGTINAAEQMGFTEQDQNVSLYKKEKLYQDLNLFLNVMGLVARDKEITELK